MINWRIVPLQIFLGSFWFKNGFIDKVAGIGKGIISPETAYQGDTWAGWKDYIVGTWDKSAVGHMFISPTFDVMFPILILLQCLPFVFIFAAMIKGEWLKGQSLAMTKAAAIASLFVTGCMSLTQNLSGAPDGQYLWQFLAFGMIALMYIKSEEK